MDTIQIYEKGKIPDMINYTGTKKVKAYSMSRHDFDNYMNQDKTSVEDMDGYIIEYLDGGGQNHVNHVNYISWSPKDVFEKVYHVAETFIDRIKLEQLELTEKVYGLSGFLSKNKEGESYPDEVVEMLERQLEVMKSYQSILQDRLNYHSK